MISIIHNTPEPSTPPPSSSEKTGETHCNLPLRIARTALPPFLSYKLERTVREIRPTSAFPNFTYLIRTTAVDPG